MLANVLRQIAGQTGSLRILLMVGDLELNLGVAILWWLEGSCIYEKRQDQFLLQV